MRQTPPAVKPSNKFGSCGKSVIEKNTVKKNLKEAKRRETEGVPVA